jgi:hypothetical protein
MGINAAVQMPLCFQSLPFQMFSPSLELSGLLQQRLFTCLHTFQIRIVGCTALSATSGQECQGSANPIVDKAKDEAQNPHAAESTNRLGGGLRGLT